MPQNINCLIKSCHYYKNGNKCEAKNILVASDTFGSTQSDSVDYEMAAELEPVAATSCMETCCKSFVPKESDKVKVDGVKKSSGMDVM